MAVSPTLQRAMAAFQAKDLETSESLARQAYRLDPQDPNAWWMLGAVLSRRLKFAEAGFFVDKALAAQPADPERWVLKLQCMRFNKASDAQVLEVTDRAIARFGGDSRFHAARAGVLKNLNRYEDSIEALRSAARIDGRASSLLLLGTDLSGIGRHAEALPLVRPALEDIETDPQQVGNACFSANAWSELSARELFAMHRQITRRFERFVPLELGPLTNTRDPHRRVRLGYMTGDAKQHSVAYFMDALLRYADKSRYEVFLYRNVSKGDEFTKRFVAMAEHDRVLTGLNEEGAARLMRKDGIDVLIDLSGLTSGSGVWMLRSRVAPVQGNYLGYCNTTGIPRCDVRFVDEVTDPAPEADALATERLVRIPGGFLCYRPDDKLPASVDWRPQAGVLRLACFNAMHKWSSATYDLWARVLREVPGATLLLKAKPIDDPGVRGWVRGQFASRGVAEDRVELLGRTQGQGDHLSMYNRVDVALDPFPYNGTTTTCELLTMGVPMITLVGDRHCARVGASINTMVGVPELNAQTPDDYVRLVRELAEDPARLAQYRRTLRERTLASTLCDGPGFVRRIEAEYARLWQAWCAGEQVGNVP